MLDVDSELKQETIPKVSPGYRVRPPITNYTPHMHHLSGKI